MRTIFLPVAYAEAADRIVALIERGVLQVQAHWHSREACQAFIDRQPRGLHQSYAPTLAIVRDAGDAGRSVTPPAPTASMTDRRDGGRVSGSPFTPSEKDGAIFGVAADHRRCDRAALLRLAAGEARHVA